MNKRFPWLDWMKVLALFSVAWGHFFSEGYHYLYVFNVQVFCVISGFLYHQAPIGVAVWKRMSVSYWCLPSFLAS